MDLFNRKRNLIKYVGPSILSLVSVFFFTVVDGIMVGRGVGTNALGAVNIIFPYVLVFTAITMLTTIGGLTITAIKLGRDDLEGANMAFRISIVMTFVESSFFTAMGVLCPTFVSKLLGANETFIAMTNEYLFWYAVFMIPCGLCMCINGFCRNDGDPILVSISTIIATLLNIFGDWLLIFPLGWGLKGAAIATGVSQLTGFFITLTHFMRKKGVLRFGRLKWDFAMMKLIIIRGLPECIAQFSCPISTIVTNIVMLKYLGNDALNAYSVICYVACFSVAVFQGTAEGIQPLVGHSYGSENKEDMHYYLKAGLLIGLIGSIIIVATVIALTPQICILYGVNETVTAVTMKTMPMYAWGFVMEAMPVIIGAYLYSTTRTTQALVINILRSFVVNIPVILLTPIVLGPDKLWLTFGIYEAIAMIVAFTLLFFADRNLVIVEGRE